MSIDYFLIYCWYFTLKVSAENMWAKIAHPFKAKKLTYLKVMKLYKL